jgi:hypothetical protein
VKLGVAVGLALVGLPDGVIVRNVLVSGRHRYQRHGIGCGQIYWPLQYRNARGGARLGPSSFDLRQCVSERFAESEDRSHLDVPSGPLVQFSHGCGECRMCRHRDALQRRTQRGSPGPEHE